MDEGASNRDLKRVYADYYEWLVAYLADWDPQHIVFEYADNRDEYESEARKMVPLVRSATSVDDLAQQIHRVFQAYFGTEDAGNVSLYVTIADAMLQKWNEMHAAVRCKLDKPTR